jgi:7 transmembrane helices usually fused to an inactive transglutaminase/Transglutaminase-like superfamily
MPKTLLTSLTALAIAALSLALMAARWSILGAEIDGTPGTAAYLIRFELKGELSAANGSIKIVLPPDFRHQHIVSEHYESSELASKVRRAKDGGARTLIWTSKNAVKKSMPFDLVYTFQCISGMRRPTSGMHMRSRVLDAAPTDGRSSKPAALIESDCEAIAALAEELTRPDLDLEDQIRVWFEHVANLDNGEAASALDCLRKHAGTDAGKARLFVALCRNHSIPARIVEGQFISPDGAHKLHHWAEAYAVDRWVIVDPGSRQFGVPANSDEYIVWGFGDDLLQMEGARGSPSWTVTPVYDDSAGNGGKPPSLARRLWRRMSLANLRPEEQAWMKFLILLPLAALVVSFFRTVIGITTFGTFGPALLGLVCRDLADFPWALGSFVAIMLIGWLLRLLLDHFHLLMVPRISVILTAIVILLILAAMIFQPYASTAHGYIALLPLIILTHMIERFWTVETEDGLASSGRTLINTVIVAVAIALLVNIDAPVNACARLFRTGNLMRPESVRTFLFRYPETLGLCLAGQLLLGRYTGYRLTELFRFNDLLLEESDIGGDDESASTGNAIESPGHSRHELP